MPNRILRESILTSDGVNQLDAAEERFYRRLMSVVDDFGRYDGRPSVIRAACFPLLLDKVREADCSRWMAACQKAGLIVLYEADSKQYVWLPKLGEPRAKRSKYPEPPAFSPAVPKRQETPETVHKSLENQEPADTCAQAKTSVPYSYSGSYSNPYPPGMLEVWKAAPAKARERSSREEVHREWKALKLEPVTDEVLVGLAAWKRSELWTKQNGQFVKGLHLWLKARKWTELPETDEPMFSDPPTAKRYAS